MLLPNLAQNFQDTRRRALLTPGDGTQAEALRSQGHDACAGAGIAFGSSQDHAFGLGTCEAGPNALHNQRALELRERADDVIKQPPHGRGSVDVLYVADEVHPQAMEVLKGRDEDTERTGKAVIVID